MQRKWLTLGPAVLAAVALGAGPASAGGGTKDPCKFSEGYTEICHGGSGDGGGGSGGGGGHSSSVDYNTLDVTTSGGAGFGGSGSGGGAGGHCTGFLGSVCHGND